MKISKNIMLAACMCAFLISGLSVQAQCDGSKAKASTEKAATDAEGDFKFASLDMTVKGMTCMGCENKVKAALKQIDGVKETYEVSAEKDMASIAYDPEVVSEEEIISQLGEKTGYSIAILKNAGVDGEKTSAKCSKECSAECKKKCAEGDKAACQKAKESGLEKSDLEEK